jgi:hypothetical protein
MLGQTLGLDVSREKFYTLKNNLDCILWYCHDKEKFKQKEEIKKHQFCKFAFQKNTDLSGTVFFFFYIDNTGNPTEFPYFINHVKVITWNYSMSSRLCASGGVHARLEISGVVEILYGDPSWDKKGRFLQG